MMFPRTADRFRAKDLQTGTIDVGEHVKRTVVITQARGPDAAAVNVAAFQPVGRSKVEPIRAVPNQLPIHEILGMHELNRGVHVHRGTGKVIIVADTDHVGVFEFLVEKRIRVRSVSIVGRPMSRGRTRGPAAQRDGGQRECAAREQHGYEG